MSRDFICHLDKMAGRGRGLGRGKGKIKLQEEPTLSEEEKQKLIRGDLTEEKSGQFEDAKEGTINDSHETTPTNDKHSSSRELSTDTTNSAPINDRLSTPLSPDSSLSPNSKVFQPKHVNGYPDSVGPGRSKSSPAQLNPNSNEFTPKSRLNVMATEFIPTSYLPPPSDNSSGEQATVPDDNMLTVLDVLDGFNRQSSIEDPVLVEAADMLITATIYPGAYDERLLEFSETIKTVPVTDAVLQDIGEMLIEWGINNTGLRYTAVRMCDFMCKVDLQTRFRGHFFTVLQNLFVQEQKKTDRTDKDIVRLMEFSLFLAEMFYRIRLADDEVVWVLGLAVVELMFILVDMKEDETIKCACNVLKLTGYLLENETLTNKQFNPIMKVDTLVLALKILCNDKSISKRACEVIINVLQFRGRKYERITYEPPEKKIQEAKVPVEVPVTCANDWSDFVDDSGNVIEGYDEQDYEHYYYNTDDDIDSNIDDEIMKGYEEFLQDFEDHLLLQEFGNPSRK